MRVIVTASILTLVIAVVSVGGPSRLESRHVSPDGDYEIRLSSRKAGPLGIETQTRVHALKRAKTLTRSAIHQADFLDDSFADAYRPGVWLSDRVLKLASTRSHGVGADDLVVIENRSGRNVAFLRINAEDLFLIVDLRDGEVLRLPTAPQAALADRSWVEGEGVWEGGAQIASAGRNFDVDGFRGTAMRYLITVQSRGLEVTASR